MAQPRIEHVNITVRDNERAALLIERIFGWKRRWQGLAINGGRTIHIGTEAQYLALYSAPAPAAEAERHAKGRPLNHIAVEVDDLDATEQRVLAAGLTPFSHGDYEPGRRFYFFDPDGIEFEVVSYR
ncbi:MAG TPA: VOC family protein [Allosphingosinicella sp.]|jgi:catechol 2,3-dioxygenase-like lactoylglutathione lyase family enzyme